MSADDFLARTSTSDESAELIRGTVIQKAAPSSEHSRAQGALFGRLVTGLIANQAGAGQAAGGFSSKSMCDLHKTFFDLTCVATGATASTRCRRVAPHWVCEILSPSNAKTDRVEKLHTYFAAVAHYWLVDPIEGSLEIFRRTELAYALVQSAHRGQRLKPEPFDALEFSVDELLGDDANEDESA